MAGQEGGGLEDHSDDSENTSDMYYIDINVWQSHSHVIYMGLNQIYGLVQERCNSIALAMELHLSCTSPSTCDIHMVSSGMNKPFLNIFKIVNSQ